MRMRCCVGGLGLVRGRRRVIGGSRGLKVVVSPLAARWGRALTLWWCGLSWAQEGCLSVKSDVGYALRDDRELLGGCAFGKKTLC